MRFTLYDILTLGDPHRFPSSCSVGPYLGLVHQKRESGDASPQLRTTKAGNPMLRHLLIQTTHVTVGALRGEDTDVRRCAREIAERGGKYSKNRDTVAVARKPAVLLHRLWTTAEVCEPLRNALENAAP